MNFFLKVHSYIFQYNIEKKEDSDAEEDDEDDDDFGGGAKKAAETDDPVLRKRVWSQKKGRA